MSDSSPDVNESILVEFAVQPGVQKVSLTQKDVAKKSAEAVDRAMSTIQNMAERVTSTINEIPLKPAQVEVTFGIKFSAESGAVIAKASLEAGINVSLTWDFNE
ncbi:hypothetical protein CEE37_12715 [candidate division LCP-89 bacterium B3_LCP]|uniref:Trypsin-co-occurring domain-containing protein n=1 Tax=candidate division LCP-89 bacterium B3_LCP TaxID=2012998 RepID=A0A532UTU9_UNCL8|nr:MAG: hypothetical protein CEE37_12715 [candidate division LCP-89 bacterium B3_LCP]